MGKFEMLEITEPRWESMIYGIGQQTSNLKFFFGRNDGWVDNTQLDYFIKKFKATPNKLSVDIDVSEPGIPHDFSISKFCQNLAVKPRFNDNDKFFLRFTLFCWL